jgi:SAM-dependent methyltransferase
MTCRFCDTALSHVFLDLGASPISNNYLKQEDLERAESSFPLKVLVCGNCYLVQIDTFKQSREMFSADYPYYSSMSKAWLAHSKVYVEMITRRLGLSEVSRVVEIASNDGYLLQYFVQRRIPCLGIEPATGTAEIARQKGIRVIGEFFSSELARKLGERGDGADLVVGNNVLAHVPDINDFVAGLHHLLLPRGTITMEFPHLLRLVQNNEFDTIYHEHYSYFSLGTVVRIFRAHDLEIYDVEELETHGGSLRIYARHEDCVDLPVTERVAMVLAEEHSAGMGSLGFYQGLKERALTAKLDLLDFLIRCRREGKSVAAYGAAAKGNTLLNYCGIKNDLISFVADAAPSKQGRYLPGSRIPVVNETILVRQKPDYVIILPWNIKNEIAEQLKYIRSWSGRFVTAIPKLEVM